LAQLAQRFAQEFATIFSQGGLPNDIETILVKETEKPLLDLLLEHQLIQSKGEAKRLIDGGGIKVDQNKINDYNLILQLKTARLIQIGKRKFVKFKSTHKSSP
jgi:tyrosyl-tRNA synthetase